MSLNEEIMNGNGNGNGKGHIKAIPADQFHYVVDDQGCGWFVALESGEAFINRTALAMLCGVTKDAISKSIKMLPKELKDLLGLDLINETWVSNSNGGMPHSVVNVETAIVILEYYTFDSKASNDTARASYRAISKAGTKLFVYAKAGYQLNINPEPSTTEQIAQGVQQAIHRVKVLSDDIKGALGDSTLSELVEVMILPLFNGVSIQSMTPQAITSQIGPQDQDTINRLKAELELERSTASNASLNLNRMGLSMNKLLKLVDMLQSTTHKYSGSQILEQAMDTIRSLETEVSAYKQQVGILASQNAKLQEKNEKLQEANNTLKRDNERLRKDLEDIHFNITPTVQQRTTAKKGKLTIANTTDPNQYRRSLVSTTLALPPGK